MSAQKVHFPKEKDSIIEYNPAVTFQPQAL